MAEQTVSPGRPVRLELNAQRVTKAIQFYETLFGWTSRPLHIPPWGSIPLIANGERVFGNQFMAMGGFALPRWLTWFTADLQRAAPIIEKHGGAIGQGIHQLGDLGMLLDANDPNGNQFGLIAPRVAPPATDAHGDPCLAEFWGREASALASFYADVLGLEHDETPTGAMLLDHGTPRLFFRNTDFEITPPRWIPYFRSSGTGGDCERARRLGAIVQVHKDTVPGIGELAVLADPAGVFFGIVDTDQA